MGNLVLAFIIGHLLADFPFQKNQLKLTKKQMVGHIFIHFCVYMVLGIAYLLYLPDITSEIVLKLVYVILLICFLHWIVDIGKEHVIDLIDEKEEDLHLEMIYQVGVFILDQITHFTIIVGAISFVFKENFRVFQRLDLLLSGMLSLDFSSQVLLTIIVLLMSIFVIGNLNKLILGYFEPDREMVEKMEVEETRAIGDLSEVERVITNRIITTEEFPTKSGLWIGGFERAIVMMCCFANNLIAVAIFACFKMLARFRQFEDKSYGDYYLLGNLISFSCAILLGYFLKFVWGFEINF